MSRSAMVIIGIVGSPAGGKSTVGRRLRELGATWVNADQLAHKCLRWAPLISQLVSMFGEEILMASGHIDRRALAQHVFGDDAASQERLDYLESVIHPYARHLALRRLSRAAGWGIPVGVLDAPLLLEADWGVLCDQIWCVDAPETLRRQWIGRRGWSPAELQRRERRQLPISEKRRLATQIIENQGSLETLLLQVDQLYHSLTARLHANASELDTAGPNHCLQYLRFSQSLPSTLPSSGRPRPTLF
ncbi:dephospho-CoA kinase [Planctomycetaceae bacterium SH139]